MFGITGIDFLCVCSDTYSLIQKEARLLWKFQRYKVVVSYINKSVVPHPLVWLAFVYHMLRGDGPKMRESGRSNKQTHARTDAHRHTNAQVRTRTHTHTHTHNVYISTV